MLEFWPLGRHVLSPLEPPLDFAIFAFAQMIPGNVEYSLKLAALKLVLAVFNNRLNDNRSNIQTLQ